MKLIDKYVYAVTRRLPMKIREEIDAELRANIEDMLPDEYQEADVEKVLYSLGNPVLLSEKYQGESRYLIGPAFYGSYISVLKIVLLVCFFISFAIAFISVIKGPYTLGNFFAVEIGLLFNLFFQGFSVVTLIFAVLSRIKSPYMQWPYTGLDWSVRDLEDIPESKKVIINRVDLIATLIFSAIGTITLCFFPRYLGWYSLENNSFTPLFNMDRLNAYVPFLVVLFLAEIVLAAFKFNNRIWNRRLAIFNGGLALCNILFTASFLLNKDLFHEEFMSVFADNIKVSTQTLAVWWQWGLLAFILFICILEIYDSLSVFRMIGKKQKQC